MDDRQLFQLMRNNLQAAFQDYERLDMYADGEQRLRQLGLAIPPELERFTVIVNWPRVVVDARVDRMDMKGFRAGDDDAASAACWDMWQRSGLEEDQSGYLDFEIYGRSFKVVDHDTNGNWHIDSVNPRDVICHRNPVSGMIDAALRVYRDVEGMDPYNPIAYRYWTSEHTYWLDSKQQIVGAEDNPAGVVPVIPAYRNPRTTLPIYAQYPRRKGVSAIKDVISVTDACARDLTNAQVAQETHAVPQRGVVGASKGDFIDPETGDTLPVWEAYFGRLWALTNPDAKTFEFASSDMANFERMVMLYARLASGVTGLPPNYFGLAADDAASADAIRSREAKLVKSIERDQRALGRQAADTVRVAALMTSGQDAFNRLHNLETLWYDPGTPTVAQRADAVTKLYAVSDSLGRGLLPREMAWEELGWSPAKIARAKMLIEQEESAYAIDPLIKEIGDGVRTNVADARNTAGQIAEGHQQ